MGDLKAHQEHGNREPLESGPQEQRGHRGVRGLAVGPPEGLLDGVVVEQDGSGEDGAAGSMGTTWEAKSKAGG